MKVLSGALIMLLLHFCCYAQQGEGTTPDGTPSPDRSPMKPRSPNAWSPTYSFSAGVWAPQSDLKILGVHPTLGLVFGLRNPSNELDLDISLRFVRTPRDYIVQRSDSLYPLHYFLGGYIGLDYTRYVWFSQRWDMGAVVSMGYDGFDIAEDPEDSNNGSNVDYLKPIDIGTLNYNLGLRINYYTRGARLSLIPRYNFLHYTNKGGSSFFGNAISIEFLVGSPW